ncbi:MAG: phosphotransferase [Actinobacteria bacterium]|nr:phosphotransferase [Actinomycetota bacterium]
MQPETQLSGGLANAGAVTRSGDHVLRPSNAHTASIHRFLRSLRSAGFEGASMPIGVDADGRERLAFIEGDVPVPPYPDWAQADDALASVAVLMRRFHLAAATCATSPEDTWSDEMHDPHGGPIVCHNDVCLENVVFRDGVAVGLIDFDFAAPGRAINDLAAFVRMCVPIDDESRARFGWRSADLPRRLRLVADAYGLSTPQRHELLEGLDEQIERGGLFTLRRVEAGDANFVATWNAMGGMARFDRRRDWWVRSRPEFAAAMV